MAHKRRTRRVLVVWAGLNLALAGAWTASHWFHVYWIGRSWGVTIGRGSIVLDTGDTLSGAGLQVHRCSFGDEPFRLWWYMVPDAPSNGRSMHIRVGRMPLFGPIMFSGLFNTWGLIAPIWRRSKHPVCRQCGYNLTGNVSGICPECGSPTTNTAK